MSEERVDDGGLGDDARGDGAGVNRAGEATGGEDGVAAGALDLVALERACTGFMTAWLASMLRPGGTLLGLGPVLMASSPDVPDLDFPNTVYGMRPEEAWRLPAIIRRARTIGYRPWFAIWPGEGSDELVARLQALGAEPTDELCIHAATPVPSASVDVAHGEPIEDHPDPMSFASTLLAGLEVPTSALDRHGSSVEGWSRVPGLERYLLYLDERPAAAAALYVDGPVAYLASAGTRPEMRRRGGHSALVARRLADAAAAGARVAGALAEPDGVSSRNLARAGLPAVGRVRRLRLAEAR